MDKTIEPLKRQKYMKIAVSVAAVVLVVGYFLFGAGGGPVGQSQQVSYDAIVTHRVTTGKFENRLNVRGRIEPKKTIYLDVIAGGRVEKTFIEQGKFVEKGQPLVQLSNIDLQLDVISREAQISEQLNFLRNTQMTAETNRLDLKRNLLENEHEIIRLKRLIKKSKPLVKTGAMPEDDFQALEEDLTYYQNLRLLNLERQEQEAKIREVQIKQLEESASRLQDNLKFARKNLENLFIKAPIDGFLSSFLAEVGESKTRGTRIGQIDILGKFKVVAHLDEFYLNQVSVGMTAKALINAKELDVVISKLDGRVNNGKFMVELDLPDDITEVKRGQSLEINIILSQDNNETLLLRRGAFINTTGGNWIFVMDNENNRAVRRQIKLGNKNKLYYQVVEGLEKGDEVITSNYSTFNKADYLILK